MFQNHHTVLAYLFPIVPELFPDMHRYEARKGDPQTCLEGDKDKNIPFVIDNIIGRVIQYEVRFEIIRKWEYR